jgi:basic membrane protein A
MKKMAFVLTILVAAAMLLSACGPAATTAAPATAAPVTVGASTAVALPTAVPPTATTAPTAGPKISVGMVTDTGGIDDKSFNNLSWQGVQQAISQLGISGKYLESHQQSDYDKNIQQLINEKDDLIVTVGFLMGVNTATAAKANPNQKFAIIDYTYPDCATGAVEGKDCGSATAMTNVRGLAFQTDQAAFLAGYLAAGMTKTGTVGTWGGIAIPTVTIFMKGYQAGVMYYNTKHNTTVKVLGWDDVSQKGTFINGFTSTDDGKNVTASMVQEGADVILPVAGGAGLGAAAYCESATPKCMIIGVDQDWFLSAPEYNDIELSSVQKRVDVAVYKTIQDVIAGKFTGGTVTYALADGGVALAPFHNFDSQVPAALKAEITQAQADIISGAVTVNGVLGEK